MNEKQFKQAYLDGDIELEAIDDYIHYWNGSDITDTLAKFLGFTEDEEAAWIDEGEEALFMMLEILKK